MDRREFISSAAALAFTSVCSPELLASQTVDLSHRLPKTDHHYQKVQSYIEDIPIPEYHWASARAYEAFRDMKFGIRVHWGIYSINAQGGESWPFLSMTNEARQAYSQLYRTWDPHGFDADEWLSFFQESGARMFSFTAKHHEGFSMYATKTRVRSRANWLAAEKHKIESCDLAYSIMETPFRRDVVEELCNAAHRRGIKIDLYYSHPDWYDADFRPYAYHPLQTPSSIAADVDGISKEIQHGRHFTVAPEPSKLEVARMMARHRDQLSELLTKYGTIDMICLDQWLGPAVWPELRKTLLHLRKLQPDVMLRARGIGNYGDYYTPEGFVPGSKENTDVPWFVIYPLGTSFSYNAGDAAHYKGPAWIIHNLVDIAAKGGNFMVGVGPDKDGRFDPVAVRQLRAAGRWMGINGEAIYATRPRKGDLWREGESIRYTRTKDNRFTYAITTKWPGRSLTLTSISPRVGSSIYLLGYPEPLKWSWDSSKGTEILIPEKLQNEDHRPCDFAWALRIAA